MCWNWFPLQAELGGALCDISSTWNSQSPSTNGNPLQYSCLESSRDRGAWWTIIHGVPKSQTWLRLKPCSMNVFELIIRYWYRSGLPWWLSNKESACQGLRLGFYLSVRKIPWRGKWQSTPVFLPGKSHEQRSLVGYSPWGHKELEDEISQVDLWGRVF